MPLKIRSMVGLIPLFAVETLEPDLLKKLPGFTARMEWYLNHRPDLAKLVSRWQERGMGERQSAFAAARPSHEMPAPPDARRDRVSERPRHPRALKNPRAQPYRIDVGGMMHEVSYWPAESQSRLVRRQFQLARPGLDADEFSASSSRCKNFITTTATISKSNARPVRENS